MKLPLNEKLKETFEWNEHASIDKLNNKQMRLWAYF